MTLETLKHERGKMSKAFLTAIFVTPQAGAGMQRVREVETPVGRGLAGDRYLLGTGYYSVLDACEVTVIEAEALERMEAGFGVHVSQGSIGAIWSRAASPMPSCEVAGFAGGSRAGV
jgi:hypothetical protein